MKIMLALLLLAVTTFAAETTETYYFVFLRGSRDAKPLPKAEGERIQAAHMANIHSLADRGVLLAAGPFEANVEEIRGIFVFRAASLDEAKRLAAEDPTVVEHRNTVQVVAWRGPTGIGDESKRLHKADPKTPEDMGIHPLFILYKGDGFNTDSPAVVEHRAYIAKLKSAGTVAASGPVLADDRIAGIVIFARIPNEEARKLLDDDPAIKAGLLRGENHRWWSSAHVLPK